MVRAWYRVISGRLPDVRCSESDGVCRAVVGLTLRVSFSFDTSEVVDHFLLDGLVVPAEDGPDESSSLIGNIGSPGLRLNRYPGPSREDIIQVQGCLLYTSPSPRDRTRSRMPSSA